MADPYPTANVTRLGQYNVSAYNVSTNQYGLDDGGYIVNFPLVMTDLVAVASWVNSYGTDFADLAGIGSDIELLADLEDGTTATGAIQAVAGVASEVVVVAGRDTDIGVLADLEDGTVATNALSTLAGLDTELAALGGLTSQLTAVGAVAGDLDAFAKSGGIVYQFASSTSGDPGAGKFGFNHSTPGNSTGGQLDDVDYYGAPAAARIDRWNNSSSAIKGTAEIVKLGDPTIRGTVEITAQVDSTGYRTVSWTPVPNSFTGTMVANDLFAVTFTRNGDAGDGDIGDQIAGAVEKTTMDEADRFGIADSGDADETKRISWANVKARFFAALGGLIAAATGKATPVDADGLLLSDSEDSGATKLLTLANLKAMFLSAFLIDEDDLASDLATKMPSQQSVKAYVDGKAINLGTLVNTTSGTAIDFTGIPAGTQHITLLFNDLSIATAASNFLILLGTSGGFAGSGYTAYARYNGAAGVSASNGFVLYESSAGASSIYRIELDLMDASTNLWQFSATGVTPAVGIAQVALGHIALAGELTQVRLTSAAGTNAFDGGSAVIKTQG